MSDHKGSGDIDPPLRRNAFNATEQSAIEGAEAAIYAACREAASKHGVANTPLNWVMPNERKLAILVEEVGEIAQALLTRPFDRDNFLKEIEQVGAMATLWRASEGE